MKKNTFFYFSNSLVLLLYFISCSNIGNKKAVSAKKTKFYNKGRFLIRESYDSSGKLEAKQFFNKDTIPDGAEIDYYTNGNVEKWKWYVPKDNYPKCVVYYNENGKYDTMKGNPFLNVVVEDKDTSTYIGVINPLNINYVIILDDRYNNKSVAQYKYEPFSLDSMNCIMLNQEGGYNSNNGHQHLLYFYIIDSAKGLLHRATKALEITKDYSRPVDVEPKSFSIKILQE